MLDLSLIRIDGDTQARAELNEAVVAEYAEAYRSGVRMPPVTLFYDGSAWWLADGFHRYHGAKAAGLSQIAEHITPGTRREAQRYSLGANGRHGLRRTAADKRLAVEKALRDPEWSQLSDRALAELCAVSAPFVGAIRRPETAERQQRARAANGAKAVDGCNPITPAASAPAFGTSADSTKNQPPAQAESGRPAINTGAPGATPTIASPAECLPQPCAAALAPQPETAALGAPSTSARLRSPAPDSVDGAEVERLRAHVEELSSMLAETVADNESLVRIFEAEDRVHASAAEISRLRSENSVLLSRVNGLMNEKAEAIRMLKTAQRKIAKLELGVAA